MNRARVIANQFASVIPVLLEGRDAGAGAPQPALRASDGRETRV